MASTGRVIINPEHLIGGDGTLRQALSLWSARNGPVTYNTWQSVRFGLCRDHAFTDEEAPVGETPAARQTRMRRQFREIEEELHGPDHLAAAIVGGGAGTVVIAREYEVEPVSYTHLTLPTIYSV